MELEKEFNIAKKTIIEVGLFLKKNKSKSIIFSDHHDIKMDMDEKAEKMIINRLKIFNHEIISEEIFNKKNIENNKIYWIIDPIDGTINYLNNFPFCSISIALWKGTTPVFGLIYNIFTSELYEGFVDKFVKYNEKLVGNESIHKKQISESILLTGVPSGQKIDSEFLVSLNNKIKEYRKIRMLGCASLSIANVALNKFDNYWENNIKLWDIAAGLAIIKAMKRDYKIEYGENLSVNLFI